MMYLYIPIHGLIIAAMALIWLSVGAATAAAQVVVTDGNLEVTFAQVPLFGAPAAVNIAPGVLNTQTVIVQNNGTQAEAVLLSVDNESSSGLADGVTLMVTDSEGATYFSDTFTAFFADIPVALGILPAGASRTYTLATDFVSSGNNIFQGTTMTFDILFGFANGASVSTGGDGSGSVVTPGTTNTRPDGIVAGAATSSPFATPDWWQPVQDFILASVQGATQSVLSYGKGAFGAQGYDEWRAELDAERAAELEQAELAAASGTATSATTQATDGSETDTWTDRLGTNFSWWILIFLGALLAGFGWTYRRSRH